MTGPHNPALIALWISSGVALAAGLSSMWSAARAKAKPVENIFLGFALGLTLLLWIAAMFLAVGGLGFVGLLKGSLLLTGAFAVIGTAFALVRAARTARGADTRLS